MVLPLAQTMEGLIAPANACPPLGIVPVGRMYWVDSADTADAADLPGYGTFNHPFASIAYAVANWCVSGRGDVIVAKPTHVEEVNGADLQLTIDDLTIVGAGRGVARPDIEIATVHKIDVQADGFRLMNFRIRPTASGLAYMLSVIGDRNWIVGCQFVSLAGGHDSGVAILLGDGDDNFIGFNDVVLSAATIKPTRAIYINGDGSRNRFCRNYVGNEFSTAAIHLNAAKTQHELMIDGTHICNIDTTNHEGVIDLEGTADGAVIGTRAFYNLDGTLANFFDFDGCTTCENYCNDAAAEAGNIVPATRST